MDGEHCLCEVRCGRVDRLAVGPREVGHFDLVRGGGAMRSYKVSVQGVVFEVISNPFLVCVPEVATATYTLLGQSFVAGVG